MKKIFSLIFLLVLIFSQCKNTASAWLDCPYNRINDPFPGQCPLYIDTNNNQICDRSEPEPKSANVIGKLANIKSDYFWTIFLTLAIYFIYWYLVNKTKLGEKIKLFNQKNFRLFWNLALFLSFILTAISSFLIITNLSSKFISDIHNLGGIIFIIIAFMHLLGRLSYFRQTLGLFTKRLINSKP